MIQNTNRRSPSEDTIRNPDNWDKDEFGHVFLRWNGRWNAWTQIASSTLISDFKNQSKQLHYGLGLFALRNFQRGDLIGFYSGTRLTKRQAEKSTSAYVLEFTDHNDLFSDIYVNGKNGTTGYVQFANDPIHTTSTPNSLLTDFGFLQASVDIPRGHEILWSYGKQYWKKYSF